jgi:TonB family protein
MNEFFTYFLKVNVALAVFYILFRVVFYRDTFWVGRRVYLISTIVISALYPFISLSGWLESREPIQVFIAEWTPIMMSEFIVFHEMETAITTNPLTWQQILSVVYIGVSTIFLLRFFVQLFSILLWRKRSRRAFIHNAFVRILSKDIAPFSFFKSIYINPDSHSERELKEVLAHESTHVRQWHSIDVLLGELLTIICWANPFAWLLKAEIRQNLEFLADNNVVKSGFNAKKYQYHLTELALYSPNIQITNRFNVSSLKKRITMMNRRESKKMGLIKYALILPVTLTLVLWSNAEVVSSSVSAIVESTNVVEVTSIEQQAIQQRNTPPPPPPPGYHVHQRAGQPITENSVWGIVGKMPEFPGGKEAQMKFLSERLRYPVIAQEAGMQGRVIAQFDVQRTGKITNVEILNGVSTELDNEVKRLINAMPDWIPGEHNGNTVIVRQTVSVLFRLQGDEPATNQIAAEPSDIVVVAYGVAASNNATEQDTPRVNNPFLDSEGNPIRPLIVIDDVVKGVDFDLSTINPDDIESISVLKGEIAIEYYGEDAKDGAVIITLKK